MNNFNNMIEKYKNATEKEQAEFRSAITAFRRAFSAVNFFLDPLVLMLLWNWFVVTLGAPSISYLLAFGISLVVAYLGLDFVISRATSEVADYETINHKIEMLLRAWSHFATLLLMLAMGFVVHLLIVLV